MTDPSRATASPSPASPAFVPTSEEQRMNAPVPFPAPGTAAVQACSLPPVALPAPSRPDPARVRRDPGYRGRGNRNPGADRHGHRRTRFQRGR